MVISKKKNCYNKSRKIKILSKRCKHKLNNLDILTTDQKFNNYAVLILGIIVSKPKGDAVKTLCRFRNKNIIIPHNISDNKLSNLTKNIHKFKKFIIEHLKKQQSGGYYFKRLEEKGEEPITGSDITRLLDEIQGITANLRYVPEGRKLGMTDTLINLFRGDEESVKSYLKFFILPKFYGLWPLPHLKHIFVAPKPGTGEYDQFKEFAGGSPLYDRYEDIGDYLLAYNAHKRAKNQYLVDQGLAHPSVLEESFMEKLTQQIDQVATRYSMLKMQLNPKRRIII